MKLVRSVVSLSVVGLLAPIARPQYCPISTHDHPAPLPYHDVRRVDDEVIPRVRAAIGASRIGLQRSARAIDEARLKSRVAGVQIAEDEYMGTPHFICSTRELLTEAAEGQWSPKSISQDFVNEYSALFEINGDELDRARPARDFSSKHNGVTHLTFQQQIDGIDIWGLELRTNVTEQGQLINISSTMLPRPDEDFAVPSVSISAARAVALAAANIGIDLNATRLRTQGSATGANSKQIWQTPAGLRADEPLTSQMLYFPIDRDTIHPAWMVVLPEPGIGNTYEITVDATDGTILRRFNRLHFFGGTETASYRVYPLDSPAPGSPGNPTTNQFQFPEVPRIFTTIGATPESPEGWIPDGVNETLGNNCDAHLDLDANNLPDLPRPAGSPFRVFDFPIDFTMAPSAYQDAAVTQVFYYMNIIHDKLYGFGFDEASGNFQTDNFGLGGVGGDPVLTDAQDGSGTNNANWNGTGTDGTTTRVQMFVFDGPTPDRDGDFDSDVVYHEYCHGLSFRLSGGTVFGEQSGGMGEGWGDYFGISMNAEPGDDPNGVYSMGGYITNNLLGLGQFDNYYFGIRRYPYTTDMSKSPLTYADTDPAQFIIPPGIPNDGFFINNPPDGVHNAGEIWCNALLHCRANLWASLGFAGNDLMMQLVVDGMKLMPGNPNFLEARDGILQADLVNNGGANLADLWAGFAARGMGVSATSPAGGSSTSGVVEAFDTPALIDFAFPNGLPTQMHPGAGTTFEVVVSALSETPIDGTGMVHYSVNGGPFQAVSMFSTGVNTYLATIPAQNCFDIVDFYVSSDSSAGIQSEPSNAPTAFYTAEVFSSIATLAMDDLEVNSGWTVGAGDDDATTGIWERGDPNGTAAQPEDDNTPSGTDCFFTGQGAIGGGLGDNDVDGGKTTLFSPSFNLAGTDARISYYRWYSNNTGGAPGADIFEVEVSGNGMAGPWVSVEVVGPSGEGTGGGWIQHEFLLSDFITPSADTMLRFIASDEGTGSLVEAAVDDLLITEVTCNLTCQPDLGFQGPGDLALSVCGPPLSNLMTNDIKITNGAPSGAALVAIGINNNPAPFKGGNLVPVPFSALVNVPLDPSGEFVFTLLGGNGPVDLFFQALAPDAGQPLGWELSNAVQVSFLP